MELWTEYLLIPTNTLNAYRLSSAHVLSEWEMARIVVHKDLIRKFIEQKIVALQFDIWEGKFWEETMTYLKVVEVLAEVASDVWQTKEIFSKYVNAKRAEEERERVKVEEENKDKN